jgi:hypothetical protein
MAGRVGLTGWFPAEERAAVRLCLFVVLVLSSPLLIACRDGSAEEDITKVTKQLAADAENKDWKGVCRAMSAKAKAEIADVGATLGGGDCAAVMARLYALDDSPEILPTSGGADVAVSDVKVNADRATAKVSPAFPGDNPRVHYVRENGAWKLDADPGG